MIKAQDDRHRDKEGQGRDVGNREQGQFKRIMRTVSGSFVNVMAHQQGTPNNDEVGRCHVRDQREDGTWNHVIQRHDHQ